VADLRRFFGSRDDVPEWASFFSPGDYRSFVAGVEAELRRRGLAFELGDGVARVVPPGGGTAQEYGLLNLAQVINHTDRAQRGEVIRHHFDTLFKGEAESQSLDALAADFEKARPLLKVRLYSEDYTDRLGREQVVSRVPAPGLLAALVYDLPSSVATVHPDHVKGWRRGVDELFTMGLTNVQAEGKLRAETVSLEKGATVTALIGDTYFAASHVLFLGDYLGAPAPFGAVVGLPHRHAVLYHAIADMSVIVAINAMITATFGMYKEGPGSISSQLYWWRGGRMACLPSRVTARQIEFAPPAEFVEEVLEKLK
jgi:hypothetical protein